MCTYYLVMFFFAFQFIDDPVVAKDERYIPVNLPLTASLPKKEKKEKKEVEKMEVDEPDCKMDIDVKGW